MARAFTTKRYLLVLMLVLAAAAFAARTIYMDIYKPPEIVIVTKGLDELGITLEVPYPKSSLQYVLLTNDGPHHVLACDILFQILSQDGTTLSSRKVVYSHPLFEKDLAKRASLVEKEPVIPPGTKWLISLGAEPGIEPVLGGVPPFDKRNVYQQVFPTQEKYRQLTVTLSAVVTDTGQAFGPQAEAFLQHLNNELLKGDDR